MSNPSFVVKGHDSRGKWVKHFATRKEAVAYARKHGGKVYRNPSS